MYQNSSDKMTTASRSERQTPKTKMKTGQSKQDYRDVPHHQSTTFTHSTHSAHGMNSDLRVKREEDSSEETP